MTTVTQDNTSSFPDSKLISQIAHRLNALGNGPRAELRRMQADAADRWRSPTFYHLYARVIAPVGDGSDAHQQAWAMILSGMARLDHRPGMHAGKTLAEQGLAESRFVRLLDADADHLDSELRAVVSYLASKAASVNWIELAWLVLSLGQADEDKARRKLAADYYRAIATK